MSSDKIKDNNNKEKVSNSKSKFESTTTIEKKEGVDQDKDNNKIHKREIKFKHKR